MAGYFRRTGSRVLAVYQIDNHCDHDLPFIGFALGNQQGKRNQRVVSDAFLALVVIQEIVALQKPDKNRGGDTLVAVGERMVLDDEVQQVGGFFFDAGIQFLAVEGLVDRLQRTL